MHDLPVGGILRARARVCVCVCVYVCMRLHTRSTYNAGALLGESFTCCFPAYACRGMRMPPSTSLVDMSERDPDLSGIYLSFPSAALHPCLAWPINLPCPTSEYKICVSTLYASEASSRSRPQKLPKPKNTKPQTLNPKP